MKTHEFVLSRHNPTRSAKARDWIAVSIMIVGGCLAAAGLIVFSFWLGIAGVIVFVVAAASARLNGIMSHTEPREEGERAYGSNEDEAPKLREERRVIPS